MPKKKAAKKKPMTKKAKKRAKDKYKAKKKRKTTKASAKKKTKKRPTKSKKQPAPAGTPFFFNDPQPAGGHLKQKEPKPQPEPVEGSAWQVTKSSKSQITDTSKEEARMFLGLMRDRAFLVSRADPEDVNEILKGFSKRTLEAYDHILAILDPNVMNLRFRTEVRFADEASAKAAAEEMQVSR